MIWWFQHNTYGINCDKCAAGYYRPYGVLKNDTNACRRKWSCSFTALSVECWVITCDWLTSMYDLWPFSLWLWPERVYRGVWGRVRTMFVSQGIHRPLLWQVSNSSLKPQCLGTQNMFPGNSIVCLVSVNRESDCCNVPSFVVAPRDTKVTQTVFPASVTWTVQMERSVHWRGASPAPVRRTLWVTAATCVPQDTTTSQNALVSLRDLQGL